jgi:hypothetical protein
VVFCFASTGEFNTSAIGNQVGRVRLSGFSVMRPLTFKLRSRLHLQTQKPVHSHSGIAGASEGALRLVLILSRKLLRVILCVEDKPRSAHATHSRLDVRWSDGIETHYAVEVGDGHQGDVNWFQGDPELFLAGVAPGLPRPSVDLTEPPT